jgi:hypothetical protein
MPARGSQDKTAIRLLLLGVGLGVLATFLPVIQVSSRTGLLTMTAWDVMPWFTKLKFAALGMLLTAAFMPPLRRWRVVIAVVAVIMVFVPAISSFLSALYAWGTVRADIVRLSGERAPLVHPGIANVVLVAAAITVSYAVWRIETFGRSGEGDEQIGLAA